MCTKIETLELLCRTCLNECLGSRYDIDEMPIALLKLFQQCIGEESQEEFYPDFLCEPCFEQLKNFDEFQSMSRKSTQFLKDLFLSQKHETDGILLDVKEENKIGNEEIVSSIPETMELLEICPQEEKVIFEEILIKEENNERIKASEPNEPKDVEIENRSATIRVVKKARQSLKHKVLCSRRKMKENRFQINCKFGCGKTFQGLTTATNHYRKKHNSNKEITKDPLFGEENKSSDIKEPSHQSSEIDEDLEKIKEKKPICDICNKSFSSLVNLRTHIKTLHEFHEKERFPCDKCERTFSVKARLKTHIKEVHANPIQIPCKYGCGKIFRRLESAKCHYRIKHNPLGPQEPKKPKNLPSFICEDCGRIFHSMAKLREHNFFHRPPEDRPFKCEQCNKSFVEKRTYEDHLKRHAGIKQFECPYCGLKKVTKRELRFHMNCHTKEKQFTCDLCQKVFGRHYNLKKHKNIVHYGIRKHKCRFCDQSFGEAATRRFHEITHTGKRPHKCKFCNRSFIQPASLKAHIKTHKEYSELSENETV